MSQTSHNIYHIMNNCRINFSDLNDQSKDYVKFGVGKNVVLNVDQQDTAIVNVGGKVRERDSARANSTVGLDIYKIR